MMEKRTASGKTIYGKFCLSCQTMKKLEEFYHKMFAKDGRMNKCKVCHDADTYSRHKARIKKDPNYRAAVREKLRRHRAKKKEKPE